MTIPSLVKKYLMALTGAVMVGFVFVHMLGNWQMFAGPDAMNGYAHFLQSLPKGILWGARSFLILALVVHVWMAILITRENRAARPKDYSKKAVVQATMASRTMGISGSILLFFIIFHLLHFTIRLVNPAFNTEVYWTQVDGHEAWNVYQMVISAFLTPWVTAVYIVSMAFLCMHLSHAVSSMFQSLGWRNRLWRPRLDAFAKIYGWVIFLGFSAIPLAVFTGMLRPDPRCTPQIQVIELDAIEIE